MKKKEREKKKDEKHFLGTDELRWALRFVFVCDLSHAQGEAKEKEKKKKTLPEGERKRRKKGGGTDWRLF